MVYFMVCSSGKKKAGAQLGFLSLLNRGGGLMQLIVEFILT